MAGQLDKTWGKGDPITYAEVISSGATAFTRTRAISVAAGTYTFVFHGSPTPVQITLLAGVYPFSIVKLTVGAGIVGLW